MLRANCPHHLGSRTETSELLAALTRYEKTWLANPCTSLIYWEPWRFIYIYMYIYICIYIYMYIYMCIYIYMWLNRIAGTNYRTIAGFPAMWLDCQTVQVWTFSSTNDPVWSPSCHHFKQPVGRFTTSKYWLFNGDSSGDHPQYIGQYIPKRWTQVNERQSL